MTNLDKIKELILSFNEKGIVLCDLPIHDSLRSISDEHFWYDIFLFSSVNLIAEISIISKEEVLNSDYLDDCIDYEDLCINGLENEYTHFECRVKVLKDGSIESKFRDHGLSHLAPKVIENVMYWLRNEYLEIPPNSM